MKDALGRRRRASQSRGLRPLYPLLPPGLRSRSIRIAMTAYAWERLGRLAAASAAPTTPRAVGEVLERALVGAGDWQDWQIRKEKQLLNRAS